MPVEAGCEGGLAWAVASRPRVGVEVSGDLHRILAFEGGVLVAVMDGLGHGPGARAASEAAAACLAVDPGAPLGVLFARCDAAARRTRGLALSLVQLRGEVARWAGVGNVEGRLLRPGLPTEGLPLTGGVVGRRAPAPREREVIFPRGGLLLLATDGVVTEALPGADAGASLASLVGRTLVAGALARDDALVLGARRAEGQP